MTSKYDAIFASMDPKEAAEFTRGDPERIKYMREVKANKKMQQQVIDYSPNKVTTTKSKPLIDVEKTLEKYEDDYVSKRGEQTIALANTAAKLKGNINKDDYILKEDGNGLMVNKNKTIAVRDSFVANVNKFKKNFNKPVQKKPSEPFKFPEFKIDPVLPLSFFKKTAPDPELVRLEQKYNQMVSESNQPKGLPGILGIKKYD